MEEATTTADVVAQTTALLLLPTKPLQVHDRCQVQWRRQDAGSIQQQQSSCTLLAAVIVERRPSQQLLVQQQQQQQLHRNNSNNKSAAAAASAPEAAVGGNKRKRRVGDVGVDIDSLPADAVDYYVHYVDHDRCVYCTTYVRPSMECRFWRRIHSSLFAQM